MIQKNINKNYFDILKFYIYGNLNEFLDKSEFERRMSSLDIKLDKNKK